jgi:phage anti-repressor protein
MQEIIKINQTQIGEDTVPAVDARELHGGLEVQRDFSNWIKTQRA